MLAACVIASPQCCNYDVLGGREHVHTGRGCHPWPMSENAAEHRADSVQVRLSPQASAFFFRCCMEEGLPHLELIKYVRTCWSSMYNLLKHAFKLRAVRSSFYHLQPLLIHDKQGIMKFVHLADNSPLVPDLQKKSYADYRLSPTEWTKLDLLRNILKVLTPFHDLYSVANLVNAAPCSSSTTILIQMRSHSFHCVPDSRVFTLIIRSC
jgi:hypothetical protein